MEDDKSSGSQPPGGIGSIDDLLAGFIATQAELRDIISYLILRREAIRDDALREIREETEALIAKIAANRNRMLLEELTCFKDILSLQERLINDNGKPRHRGEAAQARAD